MHPLIEKVSQRSFIWLPHVGIGYYPVLSDKDDYYDHYKGLVDTPISEVLNNARVALVNKYTTGEVVDVGIGDGAFIRARNSSGGETCGTDIDMKSIRWLEDEGLYRKLVGYGARAVESATFWDSIEHMSGPQRYLRRVKRYAFVSMPIYESCEDVLSSKHFKPSEHRWYFTQDGLIWFFRQYGFECLEISDIETLAGREGIKSFVFERVTDEETDNTWVWSGHATMSPKFR